MHNRRIPSYFVLCTVLDFTPAAADVVTEWNVITTQAVTAAGTARPGPSGLIDVAMVHLAMHDAIQALEGRFELYSGAISNPSGSPIAAAATAAHDVLIGVGLTTTASGSVDSLYNQYMALHFPMGDPGIFVGQAAAANMLNLRANQNGGIPAGAPVFLGGTGPGEWRPTSFTPTGQPVPMVAAYLGGLLTFTLKDHSQMRASPPPPQLTSGAYVKDYNEVKALGALNNSSRTTQQTDTALFFADNAVLYWNRTLRTLADLYVSSLVDRGRMFALVNMAMADGMITAWDTKLAWNFWRPITAIRLGEDDGNSRTEGDPAWLPYIATPNYPDYTSGANNLSGAATTMLKNFFGTDKVTFTMTSAFVHPNGATP